MATVTVHIAETITVIYELEVPDADLNEEFPTPGDPSRWGPREPADVLEDLKITAEGAVLLGDPIGYSPTTYEIESVTR